MSKHTGITVARDVDNKFDGDTCSWVCVLTDNAVKEIKAKMIDRTFYVDSEGKFANNLNTDTVQFLMKNLTGNPKPN